MFDMFADVLIKNGLVTAFAVVGATIWLSYYLSRKLTRGRLHGSAIAIIVGLLLAYFGGLASGGNKGVADIKLLSGIGIMGGAMLRDFAIISTAFGVSFSEIRKAGLAGVVSLFAGVIVSFVIGAVVALLFGYSDTVSMTTIGAGAVTYIVGPVTGAALGASSDVMALSIAAGLIKSVLVMIGTPFAAKSHRVGQPAQRHGLRRADGHHQRRGRRSGGNRSQAGALWRHDGNLLYRARLPDGPSVLFIATRAVMG